MRSSQRGDVDRIADIMEAIARIESWSSEGVPRGMYQAAVLHELMIIGEAAARVSDAFKKAHPDVPWKDMMGQRVHLAHHCWDTQWARVQRTVDEDIPALTAALEKI